DAKIEIKIEVGQKITYTVVHQGDVMINPSTIALELEDGSYFGVDANVIKEKRTQINQVIASPFYKKDHIKDNCNELILSFKEGFDLVFRAYDEGAAYRFVSTRKRDFVVKDEIAEFHLGETSQAYVPYVKTNIASKTDPVFNSFENIYVHTPINQWQGDRLAFLPLLVKAVNNKKIVITEADLEDYPGMFIENQDKDTILKGHFARYPKRVEQGGHNMLQGVVKERENYMAKCDAKTLFPWRVISISSDDKQLLDSDLVYKLASRNRIGDVSWVKPGKVAWDWWNSWNLYGVDFKTGVNNATYKYYIDFASKQGIEYVILDEGWAVNLKADLFKVIPEI